MTLKTFKNKSLAANTVERVMFCTQTLLGMFTVA